MQKSLGREDKASVAQRSRRIVLREVEAHFVSGSMPKKRSPFRYCKNCTRRAYRRQKNILRRKLGSHLTSLMPKVRPRKIEGRAELSRFKGGSGTD
jgi:hypothetical protein